MPDPLDDFRNLLVQLPAATDAGAAGLQPAGRLEVLLRWLARWSGGQVRVAKPTIAIFAGAYGFLSHGASAETDADVRQVIAATAAGNSLVAGLCAGTNIGLKLLELALDHPGGDITREPALDARACAATIAFGMEAVAGGHDVLCLSSIGAGGDVAARAILAAMAGQTGEEWADADAPAHLRIRQAALIDAALKRRNETDSLGLLAEIGGREIAAIAGAIIAARMERVPVVLDGLPAIAATVALHRAMEGSVQHCMLASQPESAGLSEAARTAGLDWVSGAGLAAAPGSDSALAVQILRLAKLADPGPVNAARR